MVRLPKAIRPKQLKPDTELAGYFKEHNPLIGQITTIKWAGNKGVTSFLKEFFIHFSVMLIFLLEFHSKQSLSIWRVIQNR
jgi:hypothetical protein